MTRFGRCHDRLSSGADRPAARPLGRPLARPKDCRLPSIVQRFGADWDGTPARSSGMTSLQLTDRSTR